MPQDRVNEFAKMDGNGRLIETMKAAGDDDLFAEYEELKESRQKEKNREMVEMFDGKESRTLLV